MTDDLKKALSTVREMLQFKGNTFNEMMEHFNLIGSELREFWPFVPFSPDGNIQCTIMPTGGDDPFELIMVRTFEPVRFPLDKSVGFRLRGITQHIMPIDGSVRIEYDSGYEIATTSKPVTVQTGRLTAYSYSAGLFIFRQAPRVAEANDFTFEKLK